MGRYEDIREAALDIMSEQGVRALTLPLLFERAHTGAGTFYHYFRDRDDLMEAIFTYCFDAAGGVLFAEFANVAAAPRERFEELCVRLFEAYVRYPRECNFLYWYTFGYVQPDEDRCRLVPSVMLLTDILTEAQRQGLVRKTAQPCLMARIVQGMAASAFWGHEHGVYEMDEATARRFAGSVWRSIEDFR